MKAIVEVWNSVPGMIRFMACALLILFSPFIVYWLVKGIIYVIRALRWLFRFLSHPIRFPREERARKEQERQREKERLADSAYTSYLPSDDDSGGSSGEGGGEPNNGGGPDEYGPSPGYGSGL